MSAAVTVADTATSIISHEASEPDTVVTLQADSGNTLSVFVESSSAVTTSRGIELVPGATAEVRLVGGVTWYGIVATGTEIVRVVEVNA